MNPTLNDAQRKLVEDNHNLIYSFLNGHNLSLDDIEDWYGTAAIGLCNAALAFDPKRGTKFSTLAYICMENEVRLTMRRNHRNIPAIISMDNYTASESGGCFTDIIPDMNDHFYPVYLNDAIEIATKKLSNRDKRFLELKINHGLTHREIAEQFGVSIGTVSRVYCKFVKSIREYFED